MWYLEWFYDAEKTRRKAVLTFDDTYPVYMTCWYESGKMKEQGRYKDGSPRWDGWTIWSENGELVLGEKEESWWNPIDAGYVAFAITFHDYNNFQLVDKKINPLSKSTQGIFSVVLF